MYKLKVISSKNIYGTMNGGSVSLKNLTDSDRELIMHRHNIDITSEDELKPFKGELFREHRRLFGEDYGFDWHKMFMADQVTKDGSHFELTDEYVKNNPNGWTDINEDILVITDKVPGVVVGHPVADCPVVMMVDEGKGVAAVGHCSAEMINRKLPVMIGNVMEEYGSLAEDIKVYVSSCAGNNWTYDKYPSFATDSEVWKDCIVDDNGFFKIDLRRAIKKQLDSIGLTNVIFNMDDTITNNDYYSNSEARNNGSKFGRQFEGCFFEEVVDDESVKKM